MNWGTVIQGIITALAASAAAYFAYKGRKTTADSKNESVYAQSIPEMIDKVQDLLEQLESKNGKIAELTTQVQEQSRTIDTLTRQVGALQQKIDKLTGGDQNEEFLGKD